MTGERLPIDMVYVRSGNINQLALITALWKADGVDIHAWAADREHTPLAGQPFDPTRRFSFSPFLRTYEDKEHRRMCSLHPVYNQIKSTSAFLFRQPNRFVN